MRTVLHLGAHKTGTSLIQKYLRDHPEERERLGLGLIPRSDMNHLIGSGQQLVEHPGRLRDRLETETAQPWTAVVASHEDALGPPFDHRVGPGLYPRAAATARLLADLCAEVGDAEVRIVYYVRPIEDFLESYYLQTVHQGGTRSFEEWVGDLDLEAIRWQPVVDALDAAFGPERVLLGDFREVAHGQSPFLRWFLERAGLPAPDDIDYPAARNRSLSDRGLRMALSVNPLLETREERKATRRFLQGHFNNHVEERARPMPAGLRERLAEQHGEEYARLAARARACLPDTDRQDAS